MAKNRDSFNVLGIAKIGIGSFSPTKNKDIYKHWFNMIYRCYSKEFHVREPSYIGCSVCEEWLDFQNYANYCIHTVFREKGWHLDKDILYKGNKIYAPNTCVYVPPEINKLFVRRNLHRGELPIGVHYEKSRGKYKSSMHDGTGKTKFLGRYYTAIEAFLAYKTAKEYLIKKMANKYKDRISPQLYNAMINYQIEITD